eukprot:2312730-Rhodomonas_salina.1
MSPSKALATHGAMEQYRTPAQHTARHSRSTLRPLAHLQPTLNVAHVLQTIGATAQSKLHALRTHSLLLTQADKQTASAMQATMAHQAASARNAQWTTIALATTCLQPLVLCIVLHPLAVTIQQPARVMGATLKLGPATAASAQPIHGAGGAGFFLNFPPPQHTCRADETIFEDKCFQYMGQGLDVTTAAAICESIPGRTLPIYITSRAMSLFIYNLVSPARSPWLGMQKPPGSGTFKWYYNRAFHATAVAPSGQSACQIPVYQLAPPRHQRAYPVLLTTGVQKHSHMNAQVFASHLANILPAAVMQPRTLSVQIALLHPIIGVMDMTCPIVHPHVPRRTCTFHNNVLLLLTQFVKFVTATTGATEHMLCNALHPVKQACMRQCLAILHMTHNVSPVQRIHGA